ncbi:hypothetical protein JB92DRAFT_3138546 [Gautieria morchelliformis]|nr:hypothetical protein JB92DRAFT_3138546 [Gautieria morchelliformis]
MSEIEETPTVPLVPKEPAEEPFKKEPAPIVGTSQHEVLVLIIPCFLAGSSTGSCCATGMSYITTLTVYSRFFLNTCRRFPLSNSNKRPLSWPVSGSYTSTPTDPSRSDLSEPTCHDRTFSRTPLQQKGSRMVPCFPSRRTWSLLLTDTGINGSWLIILATITPK